MVLKKDGCIKYYDCCILNINSQGCQDYCQNCGEYRYKPGCKTICSNCSRILSGKPCIEEDEHNFEN